MPMDNGNSAQRLWNLLDAVGRISHSTATRVAWASVLGVETTSADLLIRLGECMNLADEARKDIEASCPAFNHMTVTWHNHVKAAFISQNLLSDIYTFQSHVTEESRNYILAAANILDSGRKDLSSEAIIEIEGKINELYDFLESSSLEEKVKEYCRASLKTILEKLKAYQVTGKIPVLYAIDSTFGHLFTDDEFRKSMQTRDGSKFMEALHGVASLVTVTSPIFPQAFLALGTALAGALGGS